MLIPLLLVLTSFAQAQTERTPSKHLVLFGGSGDPPGPSTLFDTNARLLSEYARRTPLTTKIAFDGGHAQTETVVSQGFPTVPREDFTAASYREKVRSYIADIEAGRIQRGDQLMVVMSSHGAQPMEGQRAHNVSAGRGHAVDLNTLSGSETVSLDDLHRLTELAETNGIKLAILDMSCHSGASMGLGNSKTCVISAAGPQSFGYGGDSPTIFSNSLLSRMTPGKNLEELFLEARAASNDLSFPMISAGAGRSVGDELYPLLSRYQNSYYRGLGDKFRADIQKSVETRSCETEPQEIERIIALSNQVEAITTGQSFSDLRAALQEYGELRRGLQTQMAALRTQDKENVCWNPTRCNPLPRALIAQTDPARNIAEYQAGLAAATTEEERTRNREWIGYFEDWQRVRTRLLQESPGLANVDNLIGGDAMATRTYQIANRIAIESRRLFSAMESQRRTTETNACRDFVL